jgi:hypothetical protein
MKMKHLSNVRKGAWLLACLTLGAGVTAFAQTKAYIIEQPRGLIVSPGSTATFRVLAGGDPPLRYRWRRSGTTLIGQTNDTLVVSNVTNTDVNVYSVIVTNLYGGQLSRSVHLSTFTISQGPDGVGLDLNGRVLSPPAVYEIQYVSAPDATNWLTITNLPLTSTPYRFVDPEATNTTQRYYRAVMFPPPY